MEYSCNFWTVTKDWLGHAAVVMASGPSMTREVAEIVRQSRLRSIAVNNQGVAAFLPDGTPVPALAPWADILYASDRLWWFHNARSAAIFEGLKVTIAPSFGEPSTICADVRLLRNGGSRGFDDRPGFIRTGGNSGYAAVHLAASLGANPILLTGFNMHAEKGKPSHWHADHEWRKKYVSRYELFLRWFSEGAREFAARGIQIINCTPNSVLECFKKMRLEEGIEYALHYVRQGQKTSSEESATVFRTGSRPHGEAESSRTSASGQRGS